VRAIGEENGEGFTELIARKGAEPPLRPMRDNIIAGRAPDNLSARSIQSGTAV
jgi:hypothetical protein